MTPPAPAGPPPQLRWGGRRKRHYGGDYSASSGALPAKTALDCPTMSATEPGFYAVRTRALKREGVTGKRAAVTLRAGRLGIVGEDGGAIWVDPADIAAM